MNATLYYVHDPMCSWCWAFRPVLERLLLLLPAEITVVKLLGGLAPDSDEPMPDTMRERLQQTWRHIEKSVPGTHFNFDFWSANTPRRSTYPSCRAVLAAREQGEEEAMVIAIQQAYYRQARNPSDRETLIELAGEIGLSQSMFSQALESDRIRQLLEKEMAKAAAIGVDSFPSLVLEVNGHHWPVPIDYLNAENLLANIEWLMEESSP